MSINSRYRGNRRTVDDTEEILSTPEHNDYHPDDVIITGTHSNEPLDKYNFNYIVFYLLGMTTLLPWNFFVTAEDVS